MVGGVPSWSCATTVAATHAPVSYTHLDVYKRQAVLIVYLPACVMRPDIVSRIHLIGANAHPLIVQPILVYHTGACPIGVRNYIGRLPGRCIVIGHMNENLIVSPPSLYAERRPFGPLADDVDAVGGGMIHVVIDPYRSGSPPLTVAGARILKATPTPFAEAATAGGAVIDQNLTPIDRFGNRPARAGPLAILP